ncbi:MAG: nucleoside deaminase [Bacteroidales bacterium]|nr:nucleoside deaminase [Bacteroidales bacterium]
MENNRIKYYLERSIALAEDNCQNHKGGPFGAIIVKNDEIIAECGNSVTTTIDPTAHAEVNAIREACRKLNTFDLSDCEIYASCQPCPMCLSAIYWARIPKVYYAADKNDAKDAGFDDSFIYEELEKEEDKRSIRIERLRLPSSSKPFIKWKSMTTKIEY